MFDDEVLDGTQPASDQDTSPPRATGNGMPDEEGEGARPLTREEREEIRQLRQEAKDLRANAQYWHQQAQQRGGANAEQPTVEEIDDEAIIDELATKPREAMAKLGKASGFLTAAEVKTIVSQAVGDAVTKERASQQRMGKLFSAYPELGRTDSEFHRAVIAEVEQLARDFPDMPDDTRIAIAARTIHKSQRSDGRTRDQRIRSQAGDIQGVGVGEGGADDETLTPTQQHIVNRLRAFGVDEETYRKEAKAGIVMSGRR
jgi:hypothetical protein